MKDLKFSTFALEQRAIHQSLKISNLLYEIHNVHVILEPQFANVINLFLLVTSKTEHFHPDGPTAELDLTVLTYFILYSLLDDL